MRAIGADASRGLERDEALSPLIVASDGGHAALVQLLLEAGADASKTYQGRTPLVLARGWGAESPRHAATAAVLESFAA